MGSPRSDDATLPLDRSVMTQGIRKVSVVVGGHRTSVSLEPAFWEALTEIAMRRGVSVNELVTEIDRDRETNLSSAIRVFVLNCHRSPRSAA